MTSHEEQNIHPDNTYLNDEIAKIRQNPDLKHLIQYLDSTLEERVAQASEAQSVFRRSNDNRLLTPDMFAAYPESPTAKRYIAAYGMYMTGAITLRGYTKEKVENEEDCEYLKLAFHSYVSAEMCENHLYGQFTPPEHTTDLIDQYLKFRPDDVLTQYFKVIIVMKPSPLICRKLSDIELNKAMIITGEEFAFKIEPFKESLVERRILIDLFYNLGAIYFSTNQDIRALDSFKKSYRLDKSNCSSMYSVAYMYLCLLKYSDKAKKMFLKFIDTVPVCDKQYPNAHYSLAMLYLSHYRDEKEALRYYHLGEKAEEKRLPFLYPCDIPQKLIVKAFKKTKEQSNAVQ